jgi:hypothetical protein
MLAGRPQHLGGAAVDCFAYDIKAGNLTAANGVLIDGAYSGSTSDPRPATAPGMARDDIRGKPGISLQQSKILRASQR